MSSILDALKKLETESDPGTDPAGPQAVNSRQRMRRRIKTDRRVWPWVLALAICCIMLVTGVKFWRTRQLAVSPVSPPPSAVARLEKPVTPVKPVPPPPPASPKTPTKPAPIPLAPKPGAMMPETTKPQAAIPQVLAPKVPVPQAPLPRVPIPQAPTPKVPTLREATLQVPPVPDVAPAPLSIPIKKDESPPAAPPVKAQAPPDLAPLPAEVGLKLQALAWAPSAESRFAVINARILREGDSIDGVKVVRIESEQVVLRKDGELWRLRHRAQR